VTKVTSLHIVAKWRFNIFGREGDRYQNLIFLRNILNEQGDNSAEIAYRDLANADNWYLAARFAGKYGGMEIKASIRGTTEVLDCYVARDRTQFSRYHLLRPNTTCDARNARSSRLHFRNETRCCPI